jgi:Fe-S cluster assembly iron-binding protein IscA
MFQISEKAATMMKDYFKEQNQAASIRIMLSQGG